MLSFGNIFPRPHTVFLMLYLRRTTEEAPPLMSTRWYSSFRRSRQTFEKMQCLEASCHSLAQLEILVRTTWTRLAVRKFRGHGKCSQFWKNTAN
jgi:hypothetical protein